MLSLNQIAKLTLSVLVCATSHAQRTQNKKFAYLCNISRKELGLKLIFCLQMNLKVFYKLIGSLSVCLVRHAQSTQNKVYNIFVISQGNVKDELDLLPTDKHQRFLQIAIIIVGVCVTRHAQIIQNNKFAISLQYIKKELGNEVDFLHADKYESLLQIDSMILMWMVKHSQSSQNSSFAMSLQYLKKEVKDEVDFLHADKYQSFLKVYFNTLDIKVTYKLDIIIINGLDQAFSNYLK